MIKTNSVYLEKAKKLISDSYEKPTNIEERCSKAVELAAAMLDEALRLQTAAEKHQQAEIAGMVKEPKEKAFFTSITDQCFRTADAKRTADQLRYNVLRFGIPRYLSFGKKIGLRLVKSLGRFFPWLIVPAAKQMIRKETEKVIIPGETGELMRHLRAREREGVRVNLNHLGEAILGEEEAERRLNLYLEDLERPEVEYVSIKISTIYSQINHLAWDETIQLLAYRLRLLYRAAVKNEYTLPDGTRRKKFVNLDMEEYKDLDLTVELFTKVLSEEEFLTLPAGIVLQSYLPDSYIIQQKLTLWAVKRMEKGGSPIKIRIVKGANLAMEQVEASLRGWPQAPYPNKSDVDANFKRMINFGCEPRHAEAAWLGIGSHNLFDIAYTMLLCAENQTQAYVEFEMLEGMADHIRRVAQELVNQILLYCPAATKQDFPSAVAYLVRRLDENTAPDNFLRSLFSLKTGSPEWKKQVMLFCTACQAAEAASITPRRQQNRQLETAKPQACSPFLNEPDTDWSLQANRAWAQHLLEDWEEKKHARIPICIGGAIIKDGLQLAQAEDPSRPGSAMYAYALAAKEQVEACLSAAVQASVEWRKKTVQERSDLLADIAQELRKQRHILIGAMTADTAKTIPEGDAEVSEAIDFAEYYRRNLEEVASLQDIRWTPKGVALIAPPWNFPCSIPAGGILASLAAGNSVIFKPAPESILTGWELARIFWSAGVPKNVLQFITGDDGTVGSTLVKDERVNLVVLTGGTQTAKLLLKMRPGLDLMAETGGKNSIIVTSISDRDLAIKSIIQSAFGHSGQKCSACSLAILEAEVYDDKHFLENLKDAAASLKAGSAWDPASKVIPLIRPPGETLLKGLTELEEGEEWLLKPVQSEKNPQLWSPGIKLGVKPGSFTFQNELFGPVLGLVRADNLADAVKLANSTPYGLTAGLQSLDEREQSFWQENIIAGNLYINRSITGAIVQRQPFGGCKESSFGPGIKAGGPNYVMQMMAAEQVGQPEQRESVDEAVHAITKFFENKAESPQEIEWWNASVQSYAFFWKHYFNKKHDPSLIIGQDNFLLYRGQESNVVRLLPGDTLLDALRVAAASATCHAPVEMSADREKIEAMTGPWCRALTKITLISESASAFSARAAAAKYKRVRFLQKPEKEIMESLAKAGISTQIAPVLANGRIELLRCLREVSISNDYHRYGNLGLREGEKRQQLPSAGLDQTNKACGSHCCCV